MIYTTFVTTVILSCSVAKIAIAESTIGTLNSDLSQQYYIQKIRFHPKLFDSISFMEHALYIWGEDHSMTREAFSFLSTLARGFGHLNYKNSTLNSPRDVMQYNTHVMSHDNMVV